MADAAAPPAPPRFDLLLAHADSVFCVLARPPDSGTLVFVSDSARRVLGVQPAELLKRNFADLFPEDRCAAGALLAAAAAAPPDALPTCAHLRALAPSDGAAPAGVKWIEAKLSSDGAYVYAVLRDVTEEKKVEETLRCFLLSTSHDLRTPCHGMQCASALLAARPNIVTQPDTQELLRIVRAACTLMLVTIDNVMALKALEEASSAEGGGAAAAAALAARGGGHERVDACALFADVLDIVRVGFSVDVTWQDEATAQRAAPTTEVFSCAVDAVRLVLTDAACAAVRGVYLPAGQDALVHGRAVSGVAASLALDDAGGGAFELRASFVALGRALSAAEAAACFDPYGGCTGLALHVARALARALGGDVTVLPDAQPGATIHVTMRLPIGDGDAAMAAPPPAADVTPAPMPSSSPSLQEEPHGAMTLMQRMFAHLTRHSDEFFSSGIVAPDASGGQCDYISASIKHLLGWEVDDFMGRNLAAFTHPDDTAVVTGALSGAMARSLAAGGAPVTLTPPVVRRVRVPNGGYTWIKSSGAVQGDRWHTVCRSLRDQAAREVAVRSLMLAVSREMRTPAQSGLAAASLLAQRPCVRGDPEAQFLVSAISASCSLLLNMASNVISLRSIEAGTLPMRPAPFDPAQAVEELLRVCNLTRGGQGDGAAPAALDDGAPPLPRRVMADGALFCHALQNLLTNSIKFEDDRGVHVAVACTAGAPAAPLSDEAQAPAPDAPASTNGNAAVGAAPPHNEASWAPTHTLLVSVRDRGRGMSEEQCARAFAPYEASPTSQGGGTGLGLFIARACARRAGGDVTVRSAPGEGAEFTLTFPVQLAPEDAAVWERELACAPETPPKRRRSPQAAAEPEPPPPPPKRSSAAAAAAAAAAASPQSSPPLPAATAAAVAASPLRVCLADDNRLNLRLLARLLQSAGFAQVTACEDGADALAALTTAAAAGAPYHLCVLDMCMPTPGPAAARAFRKWEAERHAAMAAAAGSGGGASSPPLSPPLPRMPLFCLTANVLAEHRTECEAAGFDAFLTKPLRQEHLAELCARACAYADAVEITAA